MATNRNKNTQLQYETERDYVTRFIAEQYVSYGYYIHFHRNVEIYGVVKGEVFVTIAGENRTLKEGQIAVIDSFESHSYEIDGEAEIFYFHVGTDYLKVFKSMYHDKRLPRWLLDKKRNVGLIAQINEVIKSGATWSELKKIGFICTLFDDIICAYGLLDDTHITERDSDTVSQVVQYIYEHYAEDLTLDTLSKHFYMTPKVFSRKISRSIHCDLRIFISDVRIQKAMQLMSLPENKDKSLEEMAHACGFNSMVTFYRSYKRNFCYKELPQVDTK